MKKLRIGLVGFGSWTTDAFVPALLIDERADIVAVAGRSDETHRRAIAALGPDIALFRSIEDLLARSEVDGLILGVPINQIECVMKTALESGIPFMFEPPLAPTASGIPRMIEYLRRFKDNVHADTGFRLIPASKRAKHLVEEGAMGSLEFVTIRVRLPVESDDPAGRRHAYFDTKITLGTLMGTYVADMLNDIVGKLPKRTLLFDGHAMPARLQWKSKVLLDYGDGLLGILDLSVSNRLGRELLVEIEGTNGNIRLDGFSGTLDIQRGVGEQEPVHEDVPAAPCDAYVPGMAESVSMFLDLVESGEPSECGIEATVALQQLVMAMEASKDSGDWETVRYW